VIQLQESYDDNSLSGAYNAPVDTPSYANNGTHLFQSGVTSKNPRSAKPYFNPDFFVTEPYGQIGNAMRRSFHGPGVKNTSLTLLKDTPITETLKLQFRAEAFNVFNHTQFDGADGEIGDDPGCGTSGVATSCSGFGYTSSAHDPRIMQMALKVLF